MKKETQPIGDKIIAKLLGRTPDLDVSPNESAATLWDFYDPFCAVTVQNISALDLTEKCLVQIEQFSASRPIDMPMPFVLRPENQIREKRSGRFNLSAAQPKTIPIVVRETYSPNAWYLVDALERFHSIPEMPTKMVLGIYGGRKPARVLVCVEPTVDLPPRFTVESVPLDYSL